MPSEWVMLQKDTENRGLMRTILAMGMEVLGFREACRASHRSGFDVIKPWV
jgi:hypothetical protein